MTWGYKETKNKADTTREWTEAWNLVNNTTDKTALYAALDAIKYCHNIAGNAILVLFAYDCSHLLYSNPEEVKVLAKLGSTPAILLLPACIIFNEIKELV